jgi:tetratricopeptide (TPR) repeat protein
MSGLGVVVLVWLASALLVRAQTSDARARNLSGIALSKAGKHEEAVDQFRSALAQDPTFIPALKNLAMAELQLGRNADARLHFETALKAAPNDPMVHFGLGQLDHRERRFAEAVSHFEQSGGLYARDPNTLVQYAASCIETNQPAKATQNLERLPAEAPGRLRVRSISMRACCLRNWNSMKRRRASSCWLQAQVPTPTIPDSI